MREILFRGKRIDNGEWVEGYLIQKGGETFIECYPYCTGKIHETSWLEFCFGGFIEVIPETVGQFTGLTDKNGKKIFEGDIIFDPELKENHIVMFDEGGFCTEEMFLQFYLCFDEMEVEVIGNIL